MPVETLQLESYLESFTDFSKAAAAASPRWLREMRDEAFSRFLKAGFPTAHDEDWRFTPLSDLRRIPFQLGTRDQSRRAPSDVDHWSMKDAAARLVFIAGRFVPELSAFSNLPVGVTVHNLRDEIRLHPDFVARHFGRYVDMERDPFCALNTAFAEDGACIHVARGCVLEQPVHLLFLSAGGTKPVMTHTRNLVVVEDQGEVSIVEEYASTGAAVSTLSNTATELVARGNSTVSHSILLRENHETFNFSTLSIQQDRNANVSSHSFLLGGALVRNNVHAVLAGEGGECLINGLFIGEGQQLLDNYMLVEHKSPLCSSRQFYNGILDERAHGVFHGRILVHKDAQKTDAKQTNRNLLLTDDAQIDTKPQLEIHADDVKCTHGATIGQLEEEALFYLRSRGIGEVEARRLLLEAFAGECLERLRPDAARPYLNAVVTMHLRQMAQKRATGSEPLPKVRTEVE
jgi:Fe-S cluster assembly protein SufD